MRAKKVILEEAKEDEGPQESISSRLLIEVLLDIRDLLAKERVVPDPYAQSIFNPPPPEVR